MNIVYFVGAGASCGLKSATTAIPNMENILGMFKDEFKPEWDAIYRIINQMGFVDSSDGLVVRTGNFQHERLNIESLMQKLEDSCSSPDRAVANNSNLVFDLLTDLICRLLSKREEEAVSLLPPDDNPYRILGEEIHRYADKARHIFISFNYDLWLERALQDEGVWNPVNGYLDNASHSLDVWFKGPDSFRKYGSPQVHRTIVLKPHGSVSWFVPAGDKSATPIILVDEDNTNDDRPHPGAKGRVSYLPHTKKYRLTVQNKDYPPDIFYPLIMPPSGNKPILGRFIGEIYKSIDSYLGGADAVVVIGWSVPDTDQSMRNRISNAFASSRHMPKRLIACDIITTPLFYNRFGAIIPAEKMDIYMGGFNRKFINTKLVPLWLGKL